MLGFDLRFHSGYEVSVPLKELAGSENMLTILFRVTSLDPGSKGSPVYFIHRMKVPAIDEEAKGDAYFQGGFDVGEGRYKVEWLMRDRDRARLFLLLGSRIDPAAEGQASGARTSAGDDSAERARTVQRRAAYPARRRRAAAERQGSRQFCAAESRSATLQPLDTSALTAILRNISREPRIGKFTVVAFNLQEHRVVYRQDNAEKIDFPALGRGARLDQSRHHRPEAA